MYIDLNIIILIELNIELNFVEAVHLSLLPCSFLSDTH